MNSNSVLVGKKSGRVVLQKETMVEFPDINLIFSTLESSDIGHLYPTYEIFKEYLKGIYNNTEKSTCLGIFERIFDSIIETSNFETDSEEELFNPDNGADWMAQVLYDNFEFFVK